MNGHGTHSLLQDATMVDQLRLLDDAAMRRFIVDGYLQVQADLPAALHRRIRDRIDTVLAGGGNPGDDILPYVPEIGQVFDAPSVRGALTSLLGPDYAIHPHRHCHDLGPGADGQHWHKDDYVGDQNVRHHRFRWVMAFYYPQDVSADMGPTAILPRRQCFNTVRDNDLARTAEELEIARNMTVESSLLPDHDAEAVRRTARRLDDERTRTAERDELPLCGQAGTVNLVNFDTWHRATANRSDRMRYMLKFQFTRMREPAAGPSWNSAGAPWHTDPRDANPALSEEVWNWLCGRERRATAPAVPAGDSLPALLADLRASDEAVCLRAAYALAAMGAAVVPALVKVLRAEAPARRRRNAGRSQANPAGGNPSDLYAVHALSAVGSPAVAALTAALGDCEWSVRAAAADALGNIGVRARPAVPALVRALGDESRWVRRNALEALGTIGCRGGGVLSGLLAALRDGEYVVRRNAAIALSKVAGPAAGEAVSALSETLLRGERYVSFYAATALGRIGTGEARRALLEALADTDTGTGFAVTAALRQTDEAQ
ncbi:MAG: HEAT repeat domain-containing protein [Spirochaetaceae bacterium]|nr:HEAT repeat domain-containing protein [Spirochaetaceae bacterium]